MKKKKFPVICPLGSRVIITQGFRPSNNPTHDSVDFIIGDITLSDRENLRLSYGAQLVSPVIKAECVDLNDFGTMNSLGNGVDIEWYEDGYYYRLHFWHTVYNELVEGQSVKEGQLVGLMGNTGDCYENDVKMPTVDHPYGGTHCHLRFSRYQKDQWGIGNINIVSLDPTLYFDIYNPYTGNDSSSIIDLQPVFWAFKKLNITDNFSKLVYMLKNIFN